MISALPALSWLLLGLGLGPFDWTQLKAQDQRQQAMISDRPGVYCGAQTVGRGVFHLETGFSYDRFSDRGIEAKGFFFPMVFRFGLVDDVEIRLKTSGPGRVRIAADGLEEEVSGFSSPMVEVKWKFRQSERSRLALLASADLELGSKEFRPGKTQPGVNLASDLDLGGQYSLNTNLGVLAAWDVPEEQRFAKSFYNVALWRALSSQTSVFVESVGVYPHEKDGRWQNLINWGVAHLLSNDFQLDVSLARGLTDETSDWTLATGISLRFY